jgi:hypothetical protein
LNVNGGAATISAIDGSIMNRLKLTGEHIMNTEIHKEVLRLGRNNNLSLHGADGSCLHVHWGRVWVTRNGDIKDYIVEAGESVAIDRIGTTLVSALSDAGLSILERCGAVAQRMASSAGLIGGRADDGGSEAAGSLDLVYPSIDEIDRHVTTAKQLRAHYFAQALRRAWEAIRRVFVTLPIS